VLILLPPSQGQSAPVRGRPYRLGSFPDLHGTRETVLGALIGLCRGDAGTARRVLGISEGQGGEIARNAGLRTAPAARAAAVYTGVLYEALDAGSLDAAALRRLHRHVVVFSALWGMVRLDDRIPAYRCPAGINLPGVGPLASLWRKQIPPLVEGHGLVVDLRSGPYAAMAKVAGVTVKVMHEGRVVSHFNKAVKGRIVRGLLGLGAVPRDKAELACALRELGYPVGEPDLNTLSVG
jgi:cytoplasmic iron level regulating protein YaaA (DUF328/UPF0246 family)